MYYELSKQKHLWLKQHAKADWLTYLDDDLKYLYITVKVINNVSDIREIHTSRGIISSPSGTIDEFCTYFSTLFKCD